MIDLNTLVNQVPYRILASGYSRRAFYERGLRFVDCEGWSRDKMRRWIKETNPSFILASTSIGTDFEHHITRIGAELGIGTAQFLDHWVNAKWRFKDSEGRTLWPDYVLTVTSEDASLLVTEGLPKDRAIVIGQPEWESFVRHEFKVKDAGHVLLITQPIRKYYGSHLGYDERDFIREVLRVLRSSRYAKRKTVLALHPENSLEELELANGSRIEVMGGVTSTILEQSSLVIGMYSSILIKSALMGIPTVSFQPVKNRTVAACGLRQFITTVKSREQLSKVIAAPRILEGIGILRAFVEGSSRRLERFLLERLGMRSE
ncbi:MAG: hypothetical protein JRJ03_03195 [Deltaproteobacteria bacterium]|nr:hypothetical protein [Deltaproteobacteria bacterium]MBW2063922.1 hypothetical protein [Deltaproteobacteria bacterium]